MNKNNPGFTKQHLKDTENSAGFTLIEILVAIAIIGVLSAIIMASINNARGKARTARVQADLRNIQVAIDRLALDTGRRPTVGAPKNLDTTCVESGASNNELYLDTPAAGIESTDGNFPGWNGPYMTAVTPDPWGNSYVFDGDYVCNAQSVGCTNYPDGTELAAIHSGGPNSSGLNVYDEDNIVLVLCVE